MLQWMGGSRRKVTASRNSTLKRQKQYFEQRKKQAAALESSSNGYACGGGHKEQRSLDVLSLLNLSTVAQECHSLTLDDVKEKLEVHDSDVNRNINTHQPIAFTDGDVPGGTCQLEEAGSQSINQVKIQSSKKVCTNLPVDHKNRRNSTISNYWSTSENELSVLELLCTEGLQGSERSQIHEDHVSFSVEGIGKIVTETPVHSPQRPRRLCPYECPSRLKAAKQPRSYENRSSDLELEVDAIMQDIDASLGENTLELQSYPRCRGGSFSSQRQKLYNLEDLMQLDDHTSKVKSSFTNRKILYDADVAEQHIYNAGCGFHNGGFLGKSRRIMLLRDWPSQMDDKTIDFFKLQDTERFNFPSDESYQYNKRFSMATDKTRYRSPILDSTPRYHNFSAREIDMDFLADVPRDDMQSCSYLAGEDERDSLRSLSFDNEESCKSTAAWERDCSSFTSAENQCIRRSGDKFSSRMYEGENLNANDTSSRDSLKLTENARGSRKNTAINNHSISKPSHRFALHNNTESGISCLFEEEFPSAELSSGISAYSQTPYTKYTSSVSNLQSRKFGAFSDPELEMRINTSQKFCPDDSLEYPHSGFLSKEPFLCQSFDDVQYRNLFVKPDIVSDSAEQGPLPVASNFHEDQEFMDFQLGEKIGRDQGKEREIQTSDGQTNQPGKQCTGNEALSLEDENDLGASDGKDIHCGCKEANISTSRSPCSPEFAAETSSSSVRIPEYTVSSDDRRECQHRGEGSLLCPNGNKSGC